ncbi:glycosyl hydrolase family 18 protein [Chitinivorax sp. B]|uniref:glycoside hydrolase family 18 protein n=1 Tax=Chitinivorax sp. B TaxID=2502235 RepID=UPI0010F9F940|nr:glycosyl hydrolase family 18 protein [Chitinivorax sp. B]
MPTKSTGNTKTDSKLIKPDPATDALYATIGFNPATSNNLLNYTSARVLKPVFNRYQKDANKPKVFGYYTDWSQYDGRLDNLNDPNQAGRGYDLGEVDPQAYDKIIFGFLGITGDQGPKAQVIQSAANSMGKHNDEITFIDLWGDIAAWRNNRFTQSEWSAAEGWNIGQGGVYEPYMYQTKIAEGKAFGLLGGLYRLQQQAAAQGHKLELAFSVGGWTMSGPFSDIAASSSRRTTFINSVIDVFNRFPMFSEIDIDWEYPGGGGEAGNPSRPEDGQNYALLIKELRQALDSRFTGSNRKNISVAAAGDPAKLAKSNILDLVNNGLDGINVMTYDFFGTPWAPKLDHHTNLLTIGTEASAFSVDKAVAYLKDLGIPPQKINIGWAGYSRNGQNADFTSLSPLKGSYRPTGSTALGSFESGTSEFNDVLYNYLDLEGKTGRNGYTLYTDQVADADYLHNETSGMFISLDTPRSVSAKGRYAAQHGLGGVFTWTADQDKGVLLNAAREGAGYTISTQAIDMSGFYFSGENASSGSKNQPPKKK